MCSTSAQRVVGTCLMIPWWEINDTLLSGPRNNGTDMVGGTLASDRHGSVSLLLRCLRITR